ncbi:hypothetical protein EE612_058641, partial [Oryza sativa]
FRSKFRQNRPDFKNLRQTWGICIQILVYEICSEFTGFREISNFASARNRRACRNRKPWQQANQPKAGFLRPRLWCKPEFEICDCTQ